MASRIQAFGSVPEKPVNGSQNLTYGKQENTFLNSANKAATNSCEPLGGFRVFTSEGELFIVLGLLTVVTGWCQNSGPEEFWVQEHTAVQLPS